MRPHALHYLLAVATLGLAACDGPTHATRPVADGAALPLLLRVEPESTTTEPGESLKYTVLVRDAQGQYLTLPAHGVTWSSSDPAVVTVGAEGTLHALGSGVATVLAVSASLQARATVTVGAGPANAYTSVVAGTFHACALDVTGAAYCWGANDYGQLGSGIIESGPRTAPVRVKIPVPLVSLAAGGQHTCGLTSEGEAWCWGANVSGAVGSMEGTVRCAPTITGYTLADFSCTPTPTRVSGSFRFKQLAGAGLWFSWDGGNGFGSLDGYTCGITFDGHLFCWGGGIDGIVGTGILRGGSGSSIVPLAKPTDVRFTALAGGSYHVCGIALAGEVFCWGSNIGGELGIGESKCISGLVGTQPCVEIPRRVEGLPIVSAISAGLGFTCGLTPAGATWCWGGITNAAVPGPVGGRPAFTSLSTGSTTSHVCGITSNGQANCWGSMWYVDIRPGMPLPPRTTVPTEVAAALRFRQIAAAATHGCGVSFSGAVYCWGSNDHGQLGRDGAESRTAVRVGLP